MKTPSQICYDCGLKHGTRKPYSHTVWKETCDICGGVDMVSPPRDFGHLKEGWQNERKTAIDSQSEAAQGSGV